MVGWHAMAGSLFLRNNHKGNQPICLRIRDLRSRKPGVVDKPLPNPGRRQLPGRDGDDVIGVRDEGVRPGGAD